MSFNPKFVLEICNDPGDGLLVYK